MPLPPDEATPPCHDDGAALPGGECGRYVVLGPLGAGGMGVVLAAHDPALDRKVALKILYAPIDTTAGDASARIRFEAQAMARLAHPNVVTVFEVDRVADRTFVAMELVEGPTLRGWLRERPRPWREIVDMFVAAGRGLAAAHAAGLVHRDFKPDNVLIGRDGRPRVSDFGLVCATAEDRGVAAPPPPGVDLTTRGTAVGTPAYMSPEQWARRPVDARGDQFAFCVSLWEALWGCRPYQGTSPRELRAAIRSAALVEPPARPRVPRRLHAALRRGLAIDPGARWPDMAALLDVLVRAAGIRRRWTGAAIASGAAMVSAALTIAVSSGAPEPCAVPAARLGAVWNTARRAELGAKLAAVDPLQGAARFARIAAALDLGARDFAAMHVDACRATRIEGRQSDTMLDRRMDCLERWLGELGDTVRVIEQAGDRTAIDHAVRAATALSPLAACADVRALGEALPPPADAARRTTATALANRARELDIDQRASRLDGLSAKVRDLVAAARALDHAPTLAAALMVRARVDFSVGDETDAEATVRELIQVAARAHDDRGAAFAWTHLIMTLGAHEGKREEALALVPTATAAVVRAGDPADLRAELLYGQGQILDEGPHPEHGLALLAQARRVLEQAIAAAPSAALAVRLADVGFETGTAHGRLGEEAAAVADYREAIERWRALYGDDNPDEAFGWHNIGASLQREGKQDQALTAYRTAARIREARLGESPMTASSLVAVASILNEQGQWGDALATYDRALRIDRATLPPGDLQLTTVLIGRATTLAHLGRVEDAARGYDDALAVFERAGARSVDVAIALYNRGELQGKRGRCDDALRDHARAAALFEEMRGPNTELLIYPLVGEAACLLRAGRPAAAIARLERALGLPARPRDAFQIALARAYLGRARVETRRDVAGGLAMVRAARAAIAADAEGASAVRELDRWLATRG